MTGLFISNNGMYKISLWKQTVKCRHNAKHSEFNINLYIIPAQRSLGISSFTYIRLPILNDVNASILMLMS